MQRGGGSTPGCWAGLVLTSMVLLLGNLSWLPGGWTPLVEETQTSATSVATALALPSPAVRLYAESTNIHHRVRVRQDAPGVKYFGDFDVAAMCQEACMAYSSMVLAALDIGTASTEELESVDGLKKKMQDISNSRNSSGSKCESFTYFHPGFRHGGWNRGCYGSLDRTWELKDARGLGGIVTGAVGWNPPDCRTDGDCGYNGVCHTGRCDCVPAWTGSQCESLNLIQTPAALGYHAVARTDRTGTTERTASWGGSVVVGDDGTYHMYASEIVGGCGMNVWLANSQVVHATSPDPRMTPFVKRGVVAPVFAHEPIARRAPTGEYVIWYTAVMGDWNPPVKGGQRCSGCKDGISPKECGTDDDRNGTTNLPTYMVYSADPAGPWSEPAKIPSTDVFADSNFAPVINQNGSVVGLMRGTVVYADHWKDPSSYRVVGTWADSGEDPYVWLDKRGIYHNIVHVHRKNTYGVHYWSLDGLRWTPSRGAGKAYNNTIAYADGTSVALGCRERPHVVQDGAGNMIGLTNGAAPSTCHTAGGDDYAFTSLQLVVKGNEGTAASRISRGLD